MFAKKAIEFTDILSNHSAMEEGFESDAEQQVHSHARI